MFSQFSRVLFAAVLTLSLVGAAYTQSATQGAVAGTAKDATGALVSNAAVSIRNNGTNAEQHTTTDASGFYKAPLLEPGTYTVTVTAPSFAPYKANFVVQVGQLTEVSPVLTSGSESTTVEVTAETPVLNFDSPDFTANLNQVAIDNIPVNNRRWSALALTTPGVIADSSGFGLVSIRGISPLMNNIEIDGADDNNAYYSEERGRTREAYSTSENAVREFAVNTGVYSAEYGRAAGGVINSVTRSGTNQIHGLLYFYDRQSKWNAYQEHSVQTVANYTSGNPIPTSFSTGVHFKPKDLRKIYGFTVGGPIIRDKLFFMYTYDEHARIFPAVGSPGTPATFFAQPAAALPTGAACNSATGYLSGDTAALDQQACTLAARELAAGAPAPSGTVAGTYAAGAAAYSQGLASLLPALGNSPRVGYQEINTPKLDFQINQKEHLGLLFHRLRWDSPGGVQTGSVLGYARDTDGNDFVKLDYGVAKLTSLLGSKLSNEIVYQYGRELLAETQQPFTAYTLSNLQAPNGNIPEVDLDGSTGFYLGSPYYSYRPAQPDERKWQVEDTLYTTFGNHSLKFGVDLLHNSDLNNALNQSAPLAGGNGTSANGMYYYTYIGNYFADLASKGRSGTCNSTGAAAASATLNAVGTYQCFATNGYGQAFGNPLFAITTTDLGFFVQDNWKFSSRLTLELGVRYDYEKLPQPAAALANPSVPQTANHPSDGNNIGPRIGASYDLYGNGKTILRGGFGLYYGRIPNGTILNVQQGTGSTAGQYVTSFSPVAGSTGAGTGLTNTPVFPYNYTAVGTPTTPSVYYLASNLQNPTVEEFDMQLQQDLGHGTVFAASYLGGLGRHLQNFLNTNLDPTQTKTVNVSFIDTTGLSPIANGTIVPVKTYTNYINPAYQGITGVFSNINSSYNGLVGEIQNRSLKSLQFDLSYTWSHALDYNQNATSTTTTNGWLDPYAAARSNYGNSNYNVPNRLIFYSLYNFPSPIKGANPLKYLVNNWSFDNSFQGQSGLPYSLVTSGSTTASPNNVGSGWEGTGVTYIPVIGRNTFRYPRHLVDDVRLQKDFAITERYSVQLLAQCFNIANKQNIDGINTTGYKLAAITAPTAATAGTATATYQSSYGSVTNSNNSGFLYTPREFEIAARFRF